VNDGFFGGSANEVVSLLRGEIGSANAVCASFAQPAGGWSYTMKIGTEFFFSLRWRSSYILEVSYR
jgi:hypothetical protein